MHRDVKNRMRVVEILGFLEFELEYPVEVPAPGARYSHVFCLHAAGLDSTKECQVSETNQKNLRYSGFEY
jgi:hypothetical protein